MAGFIPPRSGELRARIHLQAKAQVPSGSSSLTASFSTVATVYAKAVAISGGMLVDGVQTEEVVTHRFFIRYRADRAAWRFVLFDDRRFEVRRTRDPDERKRWLEILAEELGPV